MKAVEILICTKTVKEIDSVKISSYGVTEKFVKVGKNVQKKLITLQGFEQREGAFTIAIYQKDSVVFSGSFGYFSGPDEIKSQYEITINGDYKIKEGN